MFGMKEEDLTETTGSERQVKGGMGSYLFS